jgi:hypothetical protein
LLVGHLLTVIRAALLLLLLLVLLLLLLLLLRASQLFCLRRRLRLRSLLLKNLA